MSLVALLKYYGAGDTLSFELVKPPQCLWHVINLQHRTETESNFIILLRAFFVVIHLRICRSGINLILKLLLT